MFNGKSHSNEQDAHFLREALLEAEKRKGFTSPNPAVGAVLVRKGEVIGRGSHWAAGYPHAEVEVLKGVVEEPEATLYVTLEPCCHFGKTPPCTDLIIKKKIKRVVFGFVDPNPLVLGKSEALLKAAGVEVQWIGLPEIAFFYRAYSQYNLRKKAWITGKLALTANEKVCGEANRPMKITGELVDEVTHKRRKEADVLVTSVKTIICDDPQLNARLIGQQIKKPVWILDRKLQFPLHSKVMNTALSVTLVHGKGCDHLRKEEFLSKGIRLIESEEKDGRLVLDSLAQLICDSGNHEAWFECGPTLFSYFLERKLFDEVIFNQSRTVVSPQSSLGFSLSNPILSNSYLRNQQVLLGNDIHETWFAKEKPID